MRIWRSTGVGCLLLAALGCRAGFDPQVVSDVGGDGGDGPPADGMTFVAPTSLSAGSYHSCAVVGDGSLWCWGQDTYGYVGVGTSPTAVQKPTRIGADLDWVEVSVFDAGSCARKSNGTLWCWGDYGGGGTMPRTPGQLGTATDWSTMAAGQPSCGLRTGGELWCWGVYVGDGTVMDRTAPTAIGAMNQRFKMVATRGSGASNTNTACAIDTSDHLWCWGVNSAGQVGNASTVAALTPVMIGAATWTAVATAGERTCGIQTGGSLYCWGGTLGSSPVLVAGGGVWTSVAVGSDYHIMSDYTCGIRDGELTCVGANAYGRLATAAPTLATPTAIDPGHSFELVRAGTFHMCAIRDGVLACVGHGAYGQLGDGIDRWGATPRALVGGPWADLGPNYNFLSCGVTISGSLMCWGDGGYFPSSALREPTTYGGMSSGWVRLGSTSDGQVGIRNDGTMWRWGTQWNTNGSGGSNGMYQLGTATTWLLDDGGGQFDCALQTDNSLWCWGANSGGVLGNGTTNPQALPFKADNNNWRAVSAGSSAACAIRATTNTLWCWGPNPSGEVGDGTTTQRNSPVQVPGGGVWDAVTVGTGHACARRLDRSLWCWGENSSGELGLGSTAVTLSPAQVGTATDWDTIAAGNRSTCATKLDGTLWCWGSNSYYQLGVDGNLTRTSPMQVGTSTTWARVIKNVASTCALDMAGMASCWGDNEKAHLGDGLAWSTAFVSVVR